MPAVTGWLCAKGHFTPDGTKNQPDRRCRTCRLASGRAKQARYRHTALGMLTTVRHEATQRGTR